MVAMLSVLVVSQDSRFLDCLGSALRGARMRAVYVEDAAIEIAENGFRPQAIVIDLATVLEPGGAELVRYLARSSALAAVTVFSISAAMKRLELAGLLGTLHRLGRDGSRACA